MKEQIMFVKHQHSYLKQQFEVKCKELQESLASPPPRFGFLKLIQDVEYLYLQVSAYEDALNDIKQSLEN